MHSIHTLAHRAPPATRTRVRWQPYSALSSLSSASPSSDSYLTTPTSAVASPTLSDNTTQQQTLPPQPANKEKNKFALGLVDQAVKSLTEIWRPQDIPEIFLTTNRPNLPDTPLPLVANHTRNISFTTISQPPSQPQSPAPQLFASTESTECSSTSRNLVPIKGFVHEVLRRSRTSASVLQTALCYLEAIRPKVSELAQLEQSGQCSMPEPELGERITPATDAELAAEAELAAGWGLTSSTTPSSEDCMDTIRITDSGSTLVSTDPISQPDCVTLKKPRSPSAPLPPLPPLPSPLLCPRRAFLASLILASKFTQDKCYSNRAWAKLSGLPPREIGRCERALGDALDWRLWVGKTPVASSAATTTMPAPRALTKCQSESNIRLAASEQTAFLVASQKKASSSRSSSSGSGLRRASTLPSEVFNADRHVAPNGANTRWIHDGGDHAMHSPETTVTTQSPSTSSSTSSTPSTPGLSYSPSSTESSSGDRTIQMSTFLDDSTMAPAGPITSDVWPWLESSSSFAGLNSASWHGLSQDSHAHGVRPDQLRLGFVSGKSIQPTGPGSDLLWTSEPQYCSLQA